MTSNTKRALLAALMGSAAIGLAAEARAQEGLEEVVVTARRVSEALQDTPVSVTAYSAKSLDRLNIQQPDKLAQYVPNLNITQQPSSTTAATVAIRGIGEQEPSMAVDPRVGMYLDGVYIARTAGSIFDLAATERIEVLRGPQGTLFGRNTTGGAIQIVTKKPTDDFNVEQKAGFGTYNQWYTKSTLNTGLIGDSPIKATVSFQHRDRQGYVDNTLTSRGDDPDSLTSNTLWATVHADIGDDVQVDYSFDWNHRNGAPSFFQLVAANPDFINYYSQSPAFGGAPLMLTYPRQKTVQQSGFTGTSFQGKTYNNRTTSYSESLGHALTVQYAANDDVTIKSITAYRSFWQDTALGLSGNGDLRGFVLNPFTFAPQGVDTVVPYGGNNAPQSQYQISQELQILGRTERWNWVAGLFYFFEHATESNVQHVTFVLPGGQAALNLRPTAAFFAESESIAAFGQASYRPPILDDKLEVTAGLRVTRDQKYINQFDSEFGFPTNVGEAQRSFNNLSVLASVNYKITDDVMAFARYTTGYKAGGYNARSNLNQYNPEKARAYEAGLKSEWFDRRLRANLSAFYTKYKDLQIQQFASGSAGATSLTLNAGQATYKGYEIELVAAPIDGLTLMMDYGNTLPLYQQFLFRDPVTNVVSNVGKEVHTGWISRQSFHAGSEYTFEPFEFGTLSARVDFTWKSQRWFHPLNRVNPFNDVIRDPGQRNWSARITLSEIALGPAQGEISVWGDNLTNQDHIQSGIDFGGLGFAGVVYGPKRTFGVDLKVTY